MSTVSSLYCQEMLNSYPEDILSNFYFDNIEVLLEFGSSEENIELQGSPKNVCVI